MQVRPDLAQLEGDHCLPGVLAAILDASQMEVSMDFGYPVKWMV